MTSKKRLIFSYGILALLLAVLFAANLFWGSVSLTPGAVLAALTGRGQDALSVGIITQLRLPRAVMVVLLGAALSAAGYLLQTFFANPIAGPFVMGISSGAKLAVALVMVAFLNHGLLTSSLTLITAAVAGPISFVGIAVPHLVTPLVGSAKPLVVLPGCCLGGAAFCLLCDLIARSMFAPTELSISAVTAVFGAPVVIWLLVRRGQEGVR